MYSLDRLSENSVSPPEIRGSHRPELTLHRALATGADVASAIQFADIENATRS